MSEPHEPRPRRPHPLERGPVEPPPSPRPQRGAPIPVARPVLTYALLGIIVAVFVLQQVFPELTLRFMKEDASIIRGGEFYRLFTAMFLHGSVVHIFFNSYALFIIGSTVEQLFGTRRFAIIYLLGGLAGSLASLVFTPAPSLGASGAIFALLGAEGVFFYLNRDLFGAFGRSRFANIVFIAVLNLILGFSIPMIDNWGHIGGLFGGLVLAVFIGPRLRVQQSLSFTPEVVDENPLERNWWAALIFAAGLLLVLFYVIASWG